MLEPLLDICRDIRSSGDQHVADNYLFRRQREIRGIEEIASIPSALSWLERAADRRGR